MWTSAEEGRLELCLGEDNITLYFTEHFCFITEIFAVFVKVDTIPNLFLLG